jgi:hypothetical protein
MQQIESAIRAAGNYVRPSEDLRPRTLEAAREHCGDRRAEQKLGGFVIAVLLLVMIGSPAIHYMHALRRQSTAPSATEMQDRGLRYAADPHIGSNWGLSEAFTQLRRLQANRIGQTVK